VFDWEQIMAMQGDSGPYIQYTYARAKSVLRKGDSARVQPLQNIEQGLNPDIPEELGILRWLYRYPEVVESAGRTYAPHLVATYLYELAARYNTFYNQHQIVGNELRIMLTQATANVLKSGLQLLGIDAPEEM
jgi:arginyl-tRNA synthetase